MANKISTVRTYPLNGAVDFTITFEYLARKFVQVTLIGKDRKELVLNQDYRFTTKTQITTSRAWTAADGYQLIEIRRFTSATDRLVDFADGSILRAYDLNISQVQTLHVAEEARDLTADTIGVNNDGHLDARGRRIVNVADGIAPGDAITLGQVTRWNASALNSANAAKASENAAKASEGNALSYRNDAQTARDESYAARDAAIGARDAAKLSQTESKTSENNARNSAITATDASTTASSHVGAAFEWGNRAENSLYSYSGNTGYSALHYSKKAEDFAEKAKTEADKLGNMNLLASQVASVDDTAGNTGNVTFKGSVYTQGGLGTLATDDKAILGFYNGGYADRWGYIGYGDSASSSIFLVNDRQQSSDAFQFNGGIVTQGYRVGGIAGRDDLVPMTAWCFGVFTGPGVLEKSQGISRVERVGNGDWRVYFSTPTASPTYTVVVSYENSDKFRSTIYVYSKATDHFRIVNVSVDTGNNVTPARVHFVVFNY